MTMLSIQDTILISIVGCVTVTLCSSLCCLCFECCKCYDICCLCFECCKCYKICCCNFKKIEPINYVDNVIILDNKKSCDDNIVSATPITSIPFPNVSIITAKPILNL